MHQSISKACISFTLFLLNSLNTCTVSTLSRNFPDHEVREEPEMSLKMWNGTLTLLNSTANLESFTWQGAIEGTTTNQQKPTYIFKCTATYPTTWYIYTDFGYHYWGFDSQNLQNPLKITETLNGSIFKYESEVTLNWTHSIVIKCMDVNNPDLFSMMDSSVDKYEAEEFVRERTFLGIDEELIIELSGTRENQVPRLTMNPKWTKWQGKMENWPLILLPCAVRDHADKPILKFDANNTELPEERRKKFQYNPWFGFVLRQKDDPENYSMWKGTIFRCQVGYSYIRMEQAGLDYPVVVVNESLPWPFSCGMKNQSENDAEFIKTKDGFIQQAYRKCTSIRSCEVEEPTEGQIKFNAQNCDPGETACFKRDLPPFGEVHCFTQLVRLYGRGDVFRYIFNDFSLSRLFFTGLDFKIYVLPTHVPAKAVIGVSGGGEKLRLDIPYNITCKIVTYFLKPIVKFAVKLKHGNYKLLKLGMAHKKEMYAANVTERRLSEYDSILTVTIQLFLTSEYETITCFAPHQNTSEWWNETTVFSNAELKVDRRGMVYLAVGGSLLLLILTSLLGIFTLKYKNAKQKLRNLTAEEVTSFLEGTNSWNSSGDLKNSSEQINVVENLSARPFNMRINKEDLIIDFNLLLGSGEFGLVYKGDFLGGSVAVKTMKPTADTDKFRGILDEVKIMEYIGHHPNIVKFYGAEVSRIRNREIWIVMEYSLNGCLLDFLRSSQLYEPQRSNDSGYVTRELTVDTLMSFCEQIACGLNFLEQLKVIHGDLAARNILVFNDNKVKLTDFGLSKRLYEFNVYKKKKPGMIPWRWFAPESLQFQEYSHKSDVWSFGVTAWEIFTFGKLPYNEILSWRPDFALELLQGRKLNKPPLLSDEGYEMLLACWSMNKDERPSFAQLYQYFGSFGGRNVEYV